MSSSSLSQDDIDAGKLIIAKLEALKAAFASNSPLEAIPPDGGSDVDSYNDELRSLGHLTWLASPWLFAECYLYRLVYTFFSMSTPFWQKLRCLLCR